MFGNTFLSDAAASTVGLEPPVALGVGDAELVDDADAVAGAGVVAGADVFAWVEVVEVEPPLLPQPTISAEIPITANAAAARLAGFALNTWTTS